ncbi:MAG TPA: SEC-C domain-containing protein [Candidatus Eremiobacteraceae bacterium]|nr:SEC-C domain-containing protein [Candidatus Eremiobacteraceae bacterium]
MNKPGRNDLCPCGSGRKYKRCCLGREAEHDAFAQALETRVLPSLSQLARFAESSSGLTLDLVARTEFPFWRVPLDDVAATRVVDHLIFDVRLERYGRTAIDQFLLERGALLGAGERTMLGAWAATPRRLYRVDGWSAGFLQVSDVLSEAPQQLSVWPLGRGAGLIADGAPVALRALPALDAFVCLGRPTVFGDRDVERIAGAIRQRHLDFVRSQRIVGMDDFLRLAPTALDEEAASSTRDSGIILPGA